MRVIANIPHSDCTITLFSWNQKYILKFEYHNFEQTFKISEFDVSDEAEMHEIAQDQEFIEKVMGRFEQMEQDLMKACGY
ncbi:MAG TPA: hypothetical protein DCS93_38945 [Microscillaceae bacterium]|nr:hypothetical protein [Microscillaceae bacterium]